MGGKAEPGQDKTGKDRPGQRREREREERQRKRETEREKGREDGICGGGGEGFAPLLGGYLPGPWKLAVARR